MGIGRDFWWLGGGRWRFLRLGGCWWGSSLARWGWGSVGMSGGRWGMFFWHGSVGISGVGGLSGGRWGEWGSVE